MKNDIKIKVCGITRPSDLKALQALKVDYAGFIFYAGSPRYVVGKMDPAAVRAVTGIRKTGVFVDAPAGVVLQAVHDFDLQLVQLHGDEPPGLCRQLQKDIPVMKVFRIGTGFQWENLKPYTEVSDYFLFDTAGPLYGGNGRRFDWSLLNYYTENVPFFLSGGIGPQDEKALKEFSHPAWHAVDVNSRFEQSPGVKDLDRIGAFLKKHI